jgi:SNF2 family DNA or RNA helicase
MEHMLHDIETAEKKNDYEGMLSYSSKLQFLFLLMANLRRDGHRVLIFSMSKKMLTLIESYLESGMFDKLYPLEQTEI